MHRSRRAADRASSGHMDAPASPVEGGASIVATLPCVPLRSGQRTRTGTRFLSPRPSAQAGTGASSFSIRIAVALNSAVPDFGSVASIVRRFVATSSWKWSVMNVEARAAAPGRSGPAPRPRRAARRPAPARPRARPYALGILGRDVERLAAPQRRRVAARLDAGVVRVEPPARSSAGSGSRRSACRPAGRARPRTNGAAVARDRVLPQPRVEEQLARVVLVVARPLDARRAPRAARSVIPACTGESARTSSQAASAEASPQSLPIRRASS